MKCHKCGSTEHLQRQCPLNTGGSAPSMLALADYSHFAGLQLDGNGGMAVPETASHHATDHQTTGYEDAPWNLNEFPGEATNSFVGVIWTTDHNWVTSDLDESYPQPGHYLKDSTGEYLSMHVEAALHNWHPGELDSRGHAWQPLGNFEEWFKWHPNRRDLYARGPKGSYNPSEPGQQGNDLEYWYAKVTEPQ